LLLQTNSRKYVTVTCAGILKNKDSGIFGNAL